MNLATGASLDSGMGTAAEKCPGPRFSVNDSDIFFYRKVILLMVQYVWEI
jgi:hypothetical protein